VYSLLKKRLDAIRELDRATVWHGALKGLEKESLRISPAGTMSQLPHPRALGSALTNRYITTDYSEALLELVTPALDDSAATRQFLRDIHQFVFDKLGDELMWPASMPCAVDGDDSVPIARYGSSNVGKMKNVYRRGLGYRYGRVMQVIAGVHFNYSLPETFWEAYRELSDSDLDLSGFRNEHYLGLIRNFHRFGWLVLYLFGTSPAVCKSFFGGKATDLEEFDSGCFYAPHATSLRMSDLGYKNKVQASLQISVNSLAEYLRDLSKAVNTPFADYQRIGVRDNGEYRQLNTNLLQIENEYYSMIRPKRVALSGERPTHALARQGVQYVEVRALDLNVFDPAGISEQQMRFMEAFVVFCLLHDSPPVSAAEFDEFGRNQGLVAKQGRLPGLQLYRASGQIELKSWALELLDGVEQVAELLDGAFDKPVYLPAVAEQRKLVIEPDATPSARMLDEMRRNGESFFQFGLRWAREHQKYFHGLQRCDPGRVSQFVAEASASHARQGEIERSDRLSFEEYLDAYFTQ